MPNFSPLLTVPVQVPVSVVVFSHVQYLFAVENVIEFSPVDEKSMSCAMACDMGAVVPSSSKALIPGPYEFFAWPSIVSDTKLIAASPNGLSKFAFACSWICVLVTIRPLKPAALPDT